MLWWFAWKIWRKVSQLRGENTSWGFGVLFKWDGCDGSVLLQPLHPFSFFLRVCGLLVPVVLCIPSQLLSFPSSFLPSFLHFHPVLLQTPSIHPSIHLCTASPPTPPPITEPSIAPHSKTSVPHSLTLSFSFAQRRIVDPPQRTKYRNDKEREKENSH